MWIFGAEIQINFKTDVSQFSNLFRINKNKDIFMMHFEGKKSGVFVCECVLFKHNI